MTMIKIPESMEIQKLIMDKQAELLELQHKKAVEDAKEYRHWVEIKIKEAEQQRGTGLTLPGGVNN